MKEFILIDSIPKHEDERGTFYESYKDSFLREKYNIKEQFVQDSHSISQKNVVRGLHYQWSGPMGKLVRVSRGSVLDVVVDIRKKSPNFGKVCKFLLTSDNINQLWIPAGFAHGFVSLEDDTHVQYKYTQVYNPQGEGTINPFDKTLDINWGISFEESICSKKDLEAQDFLQYSLNPKFDEEEG